MTITSTLGRAHQATSFSYTGSVSEGVVIEFNTSRAAVSASFFSAIRENFAGRTIAGGFIPIQPEGTGIVIV